MATIKYKYNQEWRNLEVPITIKTEGGAPYEYVEITGTRDLSPFPDLSPYISDLSQIAFLSWNEAKTISNSATGSFSIDTYIYWPIVGLALTKKSIDGSAQKGTTTVSIYINGVG